MPSFKILAYLGLAACSSNPPPASDTPDAAGSPDAPVDTSCGGGADHFAFTGAMSVDSPSFGFVTVNSKVAGVAGAASSGEIVSFGPRHILDVDLEALGDHDVAVANFMELRGPYNMSCDTGNTVCNGFYAQAGTYTVLSVHPRYHATFTLSALQERHDNSGTPGPAMAGSITGCVDKANP
jgi:hypothetical protein